jgi:hypothetical protein
VFCVLWVMVLLLFVSLRYYDDDDDDRVKWLVCLCVHVQRTGLVG